MTCSYRSNASGKGCVLVAGHPQMPTVTGHLHDDADGIPVAARLEDDPAAWVAARLPAAIEYARREQAAIARARAYHLSRYVAAGRCPIGHALDHETCGYCINAREWRATQEADS